MTSRPIGARAPRSLAVALSLLALSGCAVDDLSIGTEGAGVNLNQCYGPEINCASSVTTTTLPALEPRLCDALPSAPLKRESLVDISINPMRMVLGGDGSIWLMSREGELQHYSADGALLGQGRLGHHENPLEADIAADGRGHGFVVHYVMEFAHDNKDEVRERAYIQEYDELVMPVGAPFPLAGTSSSVIAASADSITVAGNATGAAGGVVGRFDVDLSPRWIQNKVRTSGRLTSGGGSGLGVSAISVDAAGRTALLTERPSDFSKSVFGIAQFDAQGHPVSDRKLSTAFSDGHPALMTGDAAGNLVVSGLANPLTRALIQGFDAQANPTWAWELAGPVLMILSAVAVDPVSSEVLVAAHRKLVVISKAGDSCRAYSLPPVVIGGQELEWTWSPHVLAVSASGRIYSIGGSTQPQIGSFSLPSTQ